MATHAARAAHPAACLVTVALAACLAATPARAQHVWREPLRELETGSARPLAMAHWDVAPAPRVTLIDMGAEGPRRRPRTALRMRFDAATSAMRGLGVEADDCSSLVRTSTRLRADEPGGPERLQFQVTFALSCRYF